MLERLSARLRSAATRRAVIDTAVLQAGQIVAIGAQAITSLILLRTLGPELVGVYALSGAIVSAASLLDLTGAHRVALVDVARADTSDATEGVSTALTALLGINLAVRVPIGIGLFALAPLAADLVYGRPDAGLWARWLSIPLIVDIPFDLVIVLLQGRRQMTRLVHVESTRAVATSAAIAMALLTGFGLTGLVTSRAIASGAAAAWAMVAYSRLSASDRALPRWPELLRRAPTVALRTRLLRGLSMALEKNLGSFGHQLPILMMGALRPDALGYYSAAYRTMSLPFPLISALSRNLDAILPHHALRGSRAARQAFVRVAASSGALWAIVSLATVLIAPLVLLRFGGAQYAPAVPALYPLLLGSLAIGPGVGIGATLRAIDKPQYLVGLQLLAILVTAALGWLLIGPLGAVGGAWAQSLRYTVLTIAGAGITLRLLDSKAPDDRPASAA